MMLPRFAVELSAQLTEGAGNAHDAPSGAPRHLPRFAVEDRLL